MPSTTPKQAHLMAACSHGANYPSCPDPTVAHEFNQADKGTGILSRRDYKATPKRRRKEHGPVI